MARRTGGGGQEEMARRKSVTEGWLPAASEPTAKILAGSPPGCSDSHTRKFLESQKLIKWRHKAWLPGHKASVLCTKPASPPVPNTPGCGLCEARL